MIPLVVKSTTYRLDVVKRPLMWLRLPFEQWSGHFSGIESIETSKQSLTCVEEGYTIRLVMPPPSQQPERPVHCHQNTTPWITNCRNTSMQSLSMMGKTLI